MKVPKIWIWAFCTAVSGLLIIGCDDDSGEDEPVDAGQDSPQVLLCKDTMSQICAKSCNCSAQISACMYYPETQEQYTKYNNLEECVKIESEISCLGYLLDKDFNACILALQTAPCGELFSEPGLELPAECQVLL